MNNVKKSIGWTDFTINPVKGLCPVGCSFCYARRMYKRFKWNPEIRYISSAFDRLSRVKEPSRVFVGSTMELFGEWVSQSFLSNIFSLVKLYPQHTFIFLTKRPKNLAKWSPFPDNCWIGVSVCNDKMLDVAVDKLEDIQASVKFISFEPLLEKLTLSLDYAFYYSGISWCIIGQQTPANARTTPKIEWVKEIVEAADRAGIPVFLKDNLESLMTVDNINWMKRQEFPKC